MDISQPGAARPAPARSTPTLAQQAGQIARQMFPRLNAARESVVRDAQSADTPARAAGALARGIATYPAGFVDDVVGTPVRTITGAAAPFFGGLVGSTGSRAVRAMPEAETATGPDMAARDSIAAAMNAGREAREAVTPQDRMLAYIDTLLSGPVTLREAQAASGMLPAQGAPRSAKDQAIGSASSIADATYQAELQRAQSLTDEAARDEAIQKATDRYFNRVATVSGANVSNLSLADFMPEE